MRIYYIDESEGPRYYVRSALGVNAERWNGLHGRIQDWRTALAGDYSVPTSRELHACDLLAGRGKLARIDNAGRRLTPEQGAEIFMDGLRIIENAAHSLGGIEVVNVCLRKADVKGYEQVSLDRLLNRINTSVAADGRYAHLIFDEGGERMVRRLYARLRSRNPVPSRYEAWEDGAPTKDIPIERIIGGPSSRSSQDDDLLQMADLIAHALLKQEEEPSQRVTELGIHLAFGILDRALNRRASSGDEERGGGGGRLDVARPLAPIRRFALRFRVAIEHQLEAAGNAACQLHDAHVVEPLGHPSPEPPPHGGLRHAEKLGQLLRRQLGHLQQAFQPLPEVLGERGSSLLPGAPFTSFDSHGATSSVSVCDCLLVQTRFAEASPEREQSVSNRDGPQTPRVQTPASGIMQP